MTDHGNLFGAIDFFQKGEKERDQADHRVRGLHGAGQTYGSEGFEWTGRVESFDALVQGRAGVTRTWSKLCPIAHLDGNVTSRG